MPEDMKVWHDLVKDKVAWLANEEAQRRSWYGLGPEISSPGETFNSFFGGTAVEEYLKRPDTGLTQQQLESLRDLTAMMRKLSNETPKYIDKEIGAGFIDDPRWQEIITMAKKTLLSL
jgi:hypothetical protein